VAIRSLLIDTNAYSALLRGNKEVAEVFEKTERLVFPFIVVAELLAGFRLGSREHHNREALFSLLQSHNTDILYPTAATLDVYAGIFADLRKKGTPIPTNDLWIAALAIEHQFPLYSFDAHFASVSRLTLIRS
jgi:tRNA(fMet)-specific endonuclease VapC